MTDNSRIVVTLELVAAQAKKLAMDLQNGRLWEEQLASGLNNIRAHIEDAIREEKSSHDYM